MHPYVAVPAISLLVLRAWSNRSLTPLGIVAAIATAIIHAIHPWPIFFALLVVFFLGGTTATKVKHDVKSRLTLPSTGASSGGSARTHIQVLSNSLPASVLILLHYWQLRMQHVPFGCYPFGGPDILVVGIVANYAAVAADTYSSELGILSKGRPWLVTSFPPRQVPPGTNGGVTLWGTLAGLLGASTIALTSLALLPFCPVGKWPISETKVAGFKPGFEGGKGWGYNEKLAWVVAVTLWGGLGSLLDSFLGGLLQESVVDKGSGKVVEGIGGGKVPVAAPQNKKSDDKNSRNIISGIGLLDNNGVNLLMASIMTVGGVAVAATYWGVPLSSLM